MTESLNRIAEWRHRRGLTLEQLAARTETTHQQVQRLEKGQRRLTVDWMQRLAMALDIAPAELLPLDQQPAIEAGVEPVASPFINLEVRGDVQAGAWSEIHERPSDDWEVVPVPRPDGHRRHIGLRVRGASMNLEYPEGTILVCVPFADYNHRVSTGDHVIVRRRHPETGLFESTVKELRLDDRRRSWLWPRSTDPEHQTPLRWPRTPAELADCAGAPETEVIAVVVADYRVRRPRGERSGAKD